MESDMSQAFQEELTCFICLNCLTDPVTISCGHSFCQACLHLSWEDIQLPVHCPMCREPSEQKDFRSNTVLKKLVSIARQASLMKYLSSEEHKCVTHKETKRIFCVENRSYLCQLDSDSHEHRGHQHGPIEVAAEEQMERLLQQMACLRSESMQQQLSMPQTLNLELSSLPISGLTERYSHFLFKFVFKFTSICPNNVKLFNVMRRCSFSPHGEDRSVDSARSYLASWGSDCFIEGKFYWEVDLNNSSLDWAVGACKDSWISNRNQLIESEGAFLLVCVKEGDHYSLLTTCPVFQHYIGRPLGRIGVFLDCEEGSLSFLNVAKSSLIHKYAPGTVNPSVRPFFSTGPM
ncbi:tripartite motif-containing protein 43B-like [Peromyscus leucopus]|uniref:tripartite motif-containing protein 43B-like n=1 Tax=Peromyscus leucopus TaxID=10041 RepID=UPI0010A1C179|nr:tripartite motif-containing protein 43B-like [Peromyscus leucopus]